MNVEQQWESLADLQPSPLFASEYGGNFSDRLQVNRSVIEKYLSMAALEGRVLLTENTDRRSQVAPDINPDGSVTGKRKLRWGEQLSDNLNQEGQKKGGYTQVRPDAAGWIIGFNGRLASQDLMQKRQLSARDMTDEFARVMSTNIRNGLRECLVRDKCTFSKDPCLVGRLSSSCVAVFNYGTAIIEHTQMSVEIAGIVLLCFMAANAINYHHYLGRNYERLNPHTTDPIKLFQKAYRIDRRNVRNKIEILGLPLEVDRLVIAGSYLNWQELKGQPLVRATT